jgi:DNA-binding transcriptional MerR regulator
LKINEVEQILGISKANIRFYEKQNLLEPRRSENGYRDYSDLDVMRLREIIILRKLGISVQNIERVFNGDLNFQDVIQKNISELEQQIEELKGSLELSQQIASEKADVLDTQRYWRIIQEKESQGVDFVDIVSDYWISVFQPIVFRRFMLSNKMTIPRMILTAVLFCAIFSVSRTFIWKEGNLLINFIYWPIVLSVVAVITFPIYWVGKHHPKVAAVLSTVLIAVCGLFLAAVVIVLILGLFGVFR